MNSMARTILASALAAILALNCGCLSRESLLSDVYSSRAESYNRWISVHRDEAESDVLLKGGLLLEDALKLALVHSKPLLAILEERAVARGVVIEAYGEVLPTVKIRGGYTRLDEVGGFSVGGQSIRMGSPHNYDAALEVRQPLYRGGAISSAQRAARIFSLLSDENVRSQLQRVIHDVAQDYYDVLLARKLHRVNEEAVAVAREYLNDVQKQVKGGVATAYDELRARVELSNFKAEEIKQHNKINIAMTKLLKDMGVSQDSKVVLSNELVYREFETDLEDAVRVAFQNRPDLFQKELDVRLQTEAVNIAVSRYFPSLDGFFIQEWGRPAPRNQSDLGWGRAWSGGITLEWTLFDGLRREGKLIQDRALLRQKMANLVDAEEAAVSEIHAVILSAIDAKVFYESQKSNVELAKEGFRLVKLGKEGGINTAVEVYDAQSALTRAKGFYYESVYGYMLTRLKFQRAMGTLGPPPGFRQESYKADLPAGIIPPAEENEELRDEESDSDEER